jgi:hypothetical protein
MVLRWVSIIDCKPSIHLLVQFEIGGIMKKSVAAGTTRLIAKAKETQTFEESKSREAQDVYFRVEAPVTRRSPTDPYLKNSTHTVPRYTNALGFTDQRMYNQKGDTPSGA